ncbi:AbrB/MazE/SpoVT family DNA-binding domain-containing protein [Robertmurraya kyonggiensis]|uniref:AbrB/MazE/SpoVT family DNA-binding domain-containing protein n=1 Tax=Robertmurraya kyonggiensis TaxID=1037680 RepID=A0A4U1D6Z7_9BACI|nr:AbrB/MazE/SpoVT family DNA-binding domain-containing protein [Robertmurraya kyonggiensis]TKC16967.1 AbrB/MazE/SpoVT family DNA-binding domain-containing protein [Robertmurraya kyonggiensis]
MKLQIENGASEFGNIREYRDIKITSKRQLTIPKAFFDYLGIEETVQAYLLDDCILIKPEQKKSVQEQDIEAILRKVMDEGYSGNELLDEFTRRVKEYNSFLDDRIDGFLNDITSDAVSEDDEGEDFNGLDIFFDEETGKNLEKDGEEQ